MSCLRRAAEKPKSARSWASTFLRHRRSLSLGRRLVSRLGGLSVRGYRGSGESGGEAVSRSWSWRLVGPKDTVVEHKEDRFYERLAKVLYICSLAYILARWSVILRCQQIAGGSGTAVPSALESPRS